MKEVILSNGSRGTRPSNSYKTLAQRWLNAEEAAHKYVARVIDKDEGFWFRPYSYTHRGITKPVLFIEMNEKTGLISRDVFLAIVAASLLQCKLEPGEDVLVYNPWRVVGQLRYNEGAI